MQCRDMSNVEEVSNDVHYKTPRRALYMRRQIASFALCVTVLGLTIPAFGDTLYISSGDQSHVVGFDTVLDTVTQSWAETSAQYAIAISGGQIRLAARYSGSDTGEI